MADKKKRLENDAKYQKTPEKTNSDKKAMTEKTVDADVLKEMVFAPNSGLDSGGITTPDKTAEAEDEAKEKAEVLVKLADGEIAERLGKYKEDLIEKAKKDPAGFEVETEQGWMNLREAIGKGWDPSTGKFNLDPIEGVDREGELSKLPPGEREAVEAMITRPDEGAAEAAPEEEVPAEGGVPPEMLGAPEGGTPQAAAGPGANPMMAAMMGGGLGG